MKQLQVASFVRWHRLQCKASTCATACFYRHGVTMAQIINRLYYSLPFYIPSLFIELPTAAHFLLSSCSFYLPLSLCIYVFFLFFVSSIFIFSFHTYTHFLTFILLKLFIYCFLFFLFVSRLLIVSSCLLLCLSSYLCLLRLILIFYLSCLYPLLFLSYPSYFVFSTF
jgi:hypothetical protein